MRILMLCPYSFKDNNALGMTVKMFCDVLSQNNSLLIVTTNKDSSISAEDNVYNFYSKIKSGEKDSKKSIIKQNESQKLTIIKDILKRLMPIKISQELAKVIEDFCPQVVYVQVYSSKMIRLAMKISTHYNIPVSIHFLDNWMDVVPSKFGALLDRMQIRRIARKSFLQYGGSPMMVEYLSKQYSCNNIHFLMPFADYNEKNEQKSFPSVDQPKVLLYMGNIELGRYKIIEEIAALLKKEKKNIILKVYSRQNYLLKNIKNKNLQLCKPIDPEFVVPTMKEADYLLHIESFDKKDVAFTKYSLSTKIPQCLSTNRPLFYIGPTSIGCGDFLLNNELAFISDCPQDLLRQITSYTSLNSDEKDLLMRERFGKAKALVSRQVMTRELERMLYK